MDVPPVLYNLVFGESVLNDATAIVLFRTLEEFYETPLSWGTVPLMFWRFFVIATGSIIIGDCKVLHCHFYVPLAQSLSDSCSPPIYSSCCTYFAAAAAVIYLLLTCGT